MLKALVLFRYLTRLSPFGRIAAHNQSSTRLSKNMCDQHQFFFEFDKAYTQQLIEKFEASPVLALTKGVAPLLSGIDAL